MADKAERLTAYLKHRTGDSLRAVLSYGPSGDDVLFLRDDLEGEYAEADLESISVTAWEVHDDLLSFGTERLGFDQYHSTVHTFENIFVFQLLLDEEFGLLLSFDREIGRDLHEFVRECLKEAKSEVRPDGPNH